MGLAMKPKTFVFLRLSLLCAAMLCGPLAVCQSSFEVYKKKSQDRFNAYKQHQQETVNQYRDKINKEFSNLLGHPWQLHSSTPAIGNPLKEIPPAPILAAPDNPSPRQNVQYSRINVSPSDAEAPSELLPPIVKEIPADVHHLRFSFMGEDCSLRIGKGKRIVPSGTKEAAVAKAWEAMSCPQYNLLAADFQALRERMELCDWATLEMAGETASTLCGSKTSAEAVLLQAWLLSQSGLQVAMGVDEKDALRLLVATDKQLFNYPTFFVEGQAFYVTDQAPIQKASVQPCRFPGTRPLKMVFVRPYASNEKPVQGNQSLVDENRIRFFNTYPDFCDEGNPLSSFYYHAMVPLSKSAQKDLYPRLKQRTQGKSAVEAANILLSYFYNEFEYKEDENVWHTERYFYGEETLCYRFSDCEDRAILYTWLVRDLLGLKTALVYYPGHLATAVRFPEDIPGDATLIDGARYLICDPTYVGARIGMEMTIVDTSKAYVIPL